MTTASRRVRRIDGVYKLRANPITSFRELERLESVGSVFTVVETGAGDATELNGLRRVEDFVGARENAQLTSLAGLERLERVGGLGIVRNLVIENLDGLSGLRRIDGDVQIIDNPLLSSEEIDRFLGYVQVTGRVQLAYDT